MVHLFILRYLEFFRCWQEAAYGGRDGFLLCVDGSLEAIAIHDLEVVL